MKAEFITVADSRWQSFLDAVPHDVYHLPAYAAVAGSYEEGEPTAFYGENDGTEILIPLMSRILPPALGAPSEWRDLAAPYGYPSPLVRSGGGKGSLRRCLQLFLEAGRELGYISAFLRLHPLLPLPEDEMSSCGEVVRHGQCVFVDLTLPEEEIWRRTRSNHQRQIRRLVREGFAAEIDRWSDLDNFIGIYRETMSRLGAEDFYFFPEQYFRNLRESLPDSLHLCSVRAPGGELAAAGLFFACKGLVQYHLGGTASSFLDKAPSKLMLDAIRWWGREHGSRLFHLGGGTGGRTDDLFNFKLGFSGLTTDFHTCRIVFDAEKYATLSARCSEGSGEGFFPLYRRPQVAQS